MAFITRLSTFPKYATTAKTLLDNDRCFEIMILLSDFEQFSRIKEGSLR